jgi:hypothetical protein
MHPIAYDIGGHRLEYLHDPGHRERGCDSAKTSCQPQDLVLVLAERVERLASPAAGATTAGIG